MCTSDFHKCIFECLLKKSCIWRASRILRCRRMENWFYFVWNDISSFICMEGLSLSFYPVLNVCRNAIRYGRIACRKTLIWITTNLPPHSPPYYSTRICLNCEAADILLCSVFTVLLNCSENYSKMKEWMNIYVNRYEKRIINRILSEDEPKVKDIFVQVENDMVLLTIIFNDWKIFLFLLVDSWICWPCFS